MTYREHFLALFTEANEKLQPYLKAKQKFEEELKIDGFKDLIVFQTLEKTQTEWQEAQRRANEFWAFVTKNGLKPDDSFVQPEE